MQVNMGGLLELLRRREEEGRPLRVALVGAGRFGTTVAAQLGQMRGVRLSVVCDLNARNARGAAVAARGSEDAVVTAKTEGAVADAVRADRTVLVESIGLAVSAPVEVVVEATGHEAVAVRTACGAIEHRKHVVMVTVEADALLGAALARRARKAGVVYTLADGDQPAATKRLVDWARALGYRVVAAGRGTLMYPFDPQGRPEEAFARYGFDEDLVRRRHFNAQMYNSFRDGSKAQIEMCALANSAGLVPDVPGMHEPAAAIPDLPRLFRPRSEGGILEREGVVELANAIADDGKTELPNNIAKGIWCVITSDQPLLNEDLWFYDLPASEDRRYAALWRQYHLCGVETPMSILEAGLLGCATAAPLERPLADVVAIAKRDLHAGTRLDGSGGSTVRGQIRRIEESLQQQWLPLGMAHGVTLTQPIAAGEPIPLAAVDLDPGSPLIPLRAEHEALALGGSPAGAASR